MKKRGAGETEGGIGQFFGGLGLAALGLWMFLGRVSVSTSLSSVWGGQGHIGLVLLPLGLGLALLFFSGRSILGWLLSLGSLGLVFYTVVANLMFFFQPTSLLRTIFMLTVLFVGLVMMARSLRAAA